MKKIMMMMAFAGLMLAANAQTATTEKKEAKKDPKEKEHVCSKDCKKECTKDKKEAACGEKGHQCSEACKKK
jgi:uncharacterized protein YlxW (UPF0749 family)